MGDTATHNLKAQQKLEELATKKEDLEFTEVEAERLSCALGKRR